MDMENSNHSLNITMDDLQLLNECCHEDFDYYILLYVIKLISITFFSITFILGIVGNGLVIWIAGFKMKKNVNTIWFLNLGAADFIFDAFLPFSITNVGLDYQWPFGQIMCKLMSTALFLNMSVSTSFLMIISLDRCTSVLCPVWSKNHRTSRLAYIISIAIWLMCFVLSSPNVVFFNTEYDDSNNVSYCLGTYVAAWENTTQIDYPTFRLRYSAMFITRFVSMFLIPFSIIIVCYSLIAFKVRKRRNLSGSGRIFKVIIAIVLSFFFCWFPYHIFPFINVVKFYGYIVSIIMQTIFTGLAYFNSCLNPLLYVFVGRDFKLSLIKSIPFLLESTFKDKSDIDDNKYDQSTIHTKFNLGHQ
ncbi:N-formyl peptide receptor 2-like [Bombina bombina]|uniref:N-formyl peptide receptor 2-like n=1 Tax=Bombina bombina TaxID=8345 RepID=UPI00235A66BD|nr:N-formyl peptide receptor 2-like [Bombina bombina]